MVTSESKLSDGPNGYGHLQGQHLMEDTSISKHGWKRLSHAIGHVYPSVNPTPEFP
jgi:hypothetical protein